MRLHPQEVEQENEEVKESYSTPAEFLVAAGAGFNFSLQLPEATVPLQRPAKFRVLHRRQLRKSPRLKKRLPSTKDAVLPLALAGGNRHEGSLFLPANADAEAAA